MSALTDALAQRIRAASTAHEMNNMAQTVATCDLEPADLAGLQSLYAERYRQLWPSAFRRRSRS